MPPKKNQKVKRRAISESARSSSSVSGKVKAFKRPGLLVSQKQDNNKVIQAAAGALAGFAAGALAGTVFGKNKKEVVVVPGEPQDADSVKFQINTAKSKVFRECKETEEKKIQTLNEKNEKNTTTIKEQSVKIRELTAENSKMKAQIDTFERRYKNFEDKQKEIELELQNSKRYAEFISRNKYY